jgi:transcriptional regulator with PAS, ATPase and Fis domain
MSARFYIDANADGKKDNNEWVHPGVSTKSVSNLIPNNNDNYATNKLHVFSKVSEKTNASKKKHANRSILYDSRINEKLDELRSILNSKNIFPGRSKRELLQGITQFIKDTSIIIEEKEVYLKELTKQEKFLNCIKNSCSQALYVMDNTFNICEVYGAYSSITGHTKEQLIGEQFLRSVHPEDINYVKIFFTNVFNNESIGDIKKQNNNTISNNTNDNSSDNTVMKWPTYSTRLPAILYPLQFRRKHATHLYYVPVQINCHTVISVDNDSNFFHDDNDNVKYKIFFSEFTNIV